MRTVKGFMGKTHVLLSVMLFCLCMLIPVDFFQETIGIMKNEALFFIVGIVVLAGGALLPDLDNAQSSAGATLGPVGSICTTFMQTISSILWNLLHGKGDKPPQTQHRYFWHTLVAGASIFCLFFFGMPKGEQTLVSSYKETKEITTWLQNNVAVLVLFIFVFVAILVGSDKVFSFFIKKFSLPKILSYILPTACVVYTVFLNFTHLRILGLCIGMGYAFHCIEDCFADSGVPLFWPIPIGRQMWHRIRFIPVTIKTGGLTNTILDIVILVIDIILIVVIFTTKSIGVVPPNL